VRTISTTNAAQILSERKFITILRQTLEEAQKATKDIEEGVAKINVVQEPNSANDPSSSSSARPSRKRKRSGEVIPVGSQECDQLPKLVQAVSAALIYISKSANAIGDTANGVPSSVFSAEYMKMVLTTTAEESGKVLGTWLSLSQNIMLHIRGTDSITNTVWFSPFIDIWELHTTETEELMHFSVFCSQPLLSLLQSARRGNDTASNWASELDQLVARNIIIPAKTAKANDPDSDLLNTLTRASVIQDSANASLLFDVAIRSLQRTGSHRRRPQDNAWIQTVFTVLKDAMAPKRAEANRKAIQQMLQSAIDHTVAFDLPLLRSVVSEYALSEETTDWDFLSTVIKLDANTFLIPDEEKDLLKVVLARITAAAIDSTWAELYDPVVHNVTIPLMKEFAKARDLSGFIHHWYSQLVQFEKLRKEARLFSMSLFSAWEDDALQLELSKLLEPSLTVQQIVQLLDWLSSEVKTNPDSVCVILEAIAGSITHEDVIDVVGLRLYYIMFNDEVSDKLDGRYEWRSWRILSRTLSWIEADGREELSRLWLEKKKPFDTLDVKGGISGLLEIVAGNTVELEILEILKFVCAAWSSAETGSQLRSLASKPLLKLLQGLANDIKIFPQDLKSGQELGDEICGSDLRTLYRGAGWMIWSFVKCVFMEYAEVLQ
jgi:nucleolar pre-ribosomal-associated protein 2